MSLQAAAEAAGTLQSPTVQYQFSQYVNEADAARERLIEMGRPDLAEALSGERASPEQAAALLVSLTGVLAPGSNGYAGPGISLLRGDTAYGTPSSQGYTSPTTAPGTAGPTQTQQGGFWGVVEGIFSPLKTGLQEVANLIGQGAGGIRINFLKWIPFLVGGLIVMKVLDPNIRFKAGPIRADVGK